MAEPLGATNVDRIASPGSDGLVPSLLADDDDLREVLEEYVATMSEKRAVLLDLASRGDAEGLRASAHQLAGSAGSYGYPELSQLALAVEEACRRGNAEAARAAALTLADYLPRVVTR